MYLFQLATSLGLSIVIGMLLILAVGENPLAVYSGLIEKAFFDPFGFMIAVQRMTPLILASAAAVLAFRGGAINMGLEGQFAVGATVAGVIGFMVPEMPKVFAIPIVLVFCGLAGAAAAWIPAFFKVVSGISEVITGMIANLVVPQLFGILLSVPFLRTARMGASRSGIPPWVQLDKFSDLTNGAIGAGTHANTGIFLSIGLMLCIAYVFKRSKIGYEISMANANFFMAEFSGIKAKRSFYMAMMLSGAVAAMAGATESLGIYRNASSGTISVGYNALMMALAGGNTFVGSAMASFVLGGLQSGAMNASWSTTVPRPFIDFLVALLMLFAAVPSMRLFFSGSNMLDSERLGGQFTHRE